MKLLTHLKSLSDDGLSAFADMAGTSVGYLNQVAYGYKQIGPAFALRIEIASGGALSARELSPDFPWDEAAKILCPVCSQ
jgi:DNA-binding transcriptional regulator YdaS (Cro superfamily)